MTDRVVIVGAGVAGVSAAGALRAAGHEGEIVLLGDEPELPYRRPPVSKEIVRGEKDADGIRIKPAAWYDDQNIDLRTGVHVASIDTNAHEVVLGDGSTLAYASLLLATGGRARTLGTDIPGVITLRSVTDAAALTGKVGEGDHVIVVGAGLIGSEIAASLRKLGVDVTLLETAPSPLPRVLPPALAELYVDVHQGEGTQLHTGVTIEGIDVDGDGTVDQAVVRAGDGRTWTAPYVIVAIGMIPNTEVAEAAGIELDPVFGGIAVDEFGRTSAPDVYAAGDVAATPNLVLGGRHRVEHWQNAQNHGTAIGKVIAGQETPWREVPWAWSDQYGYNLQVTGWPAADQEIVVRGALADRNFVAFFLDADGVIRGAIGIGRPGDIRAVRVWIGDQVRPDPAKLADETVPLAEALLQDEVV